MDIKIFTGIMKNFLVVCIVCMTSPLLAQNYTRDAGLRLGTLPSFVYRHYQDEDKAFEFIASFTWRSLRLSFLKENCKPALIQFSENTRFVFGYGAHVGLDYTNRYRLFFRTYHTGSWKMSPLFGLDAYLALEYQFREFPFILGVDYKPFFEFSTNRIFYIFVDDAALSLKYKF